MHAAFLIVCGVVLVGLGLFIALYGRESKPQHFDGPLTHHERALWFERRLLLEAVQVGVLSFGLTLFVLVTTR